MARPKRSEGTRQRLLDEGLTALRARGYNGTGIKEVLERVRVPKGSFYNYFASKEQFGAEVIRHYADRCCAEMDAALAPAGNDALGALRAYFEGEIAGQERAGVGCLVGTLGAEIGGCRGLCREAIDEAMRSFGSRLTEVLRRGQEQGSVRDDLPAAELAAFLLNAWEGALIRMKVLGSVEPLRQCCSFVLDDFIRPAGRGQAGPL